ncbi:MAG: DUF1801 domain-containing protein [Pseudomonadota bacterium]
MARPSIAEKGGTRKSNDKGLKTRPNEADVGAFLDAVGDVQKRADAEELLGMMGRVTGRTPVMWGTSIIGFGSYRYTNTTGREAEWCATGFSPRKSALTVYIMPGFSGMEPLMKKLGKHKTGRSCLYIKRLSDVDRSVLEEIISKAYQTIRQRYPD